MNAILLVRYLGKHPWLALAAGVGMATVSVLRIRNERREKKEAKRTAKLERERLRSERHAAKVQPRH